MLINILLILKCGVLIGRSIAYDSISITHCAFVYIYNLPSCSWLSIIFFYTSLKNMDKHTVFTKENQFLLLIQKKKTIIEYKETKFPNLKKKGWINIKKEFNAYFGVTSCIAKLPFLCLFLLIFKVLINSRVKISSISAIFASVMISILFTAHAQLRLT